MWLEIRQGTLKAEIIQALEQLNMNNYEAVKPLNKTEDLENRQSKKAPPCVTESFFNVLLSKHKH